MLTRPLTLSEGDDRGRGQITVTPPPALPLADEDDDESQTGVFSPPAPPWSSSSSSSPSSPPPPPPPPPSSSSSSSSSSSCAPSFPPPLPPPPCPLSLRPPVSPPCTPSHLPPVSPACVPPLVLPPATAAPPPAPRPCALSPHLLCAPLLLPPPPCASLPPPAPTPCTPSLPLPALVPPPPVPPPPCCSCSSLLPRLLSAHRLEMRRLLRGALASLGRRLDSLERRSRRKMRKKSRNRQRGRGGGGEEEEVGGAAGRSPGSTVFSPTPLCGPAHLPPVSTSSSLSSSSSDSEDSTTPPPSSSLSQSEQRRRRRRSRGEEEEGEGRGRKRRRKNQRGCVPPENREEEEEEEENAGRFVGRMVVSFRGGAEEEEEEAPLTLYNFSHRKHRRREGARANQSEKTVSVFRRNGYRSPPPHNSSSFSSQHALHLLQSAQRHQTCSQSEALFSVSSGQWHFSDFTPPLPLSSNNSGFHLWLCSSSSSSSALSPASMLRLSAVAVETMSESVKGGASWSPLRSLKDWTAPPSLSSDHCYVRTSSASPTFSTRRHQKQRANHSSRSLHLTRRWPMALPPCSTNRLSAPLPTSQSATCSEFLSTNGERGKRVSQIRIRRASPREMQLTPMGLPKVKRLKKKEFSLEEIYTNKNYKSPSTNRSLETIFEEPREKDGALLRIGHQRRRRLLLFPDFTQPRKRKKPQVAGLPPVAMVPRKRAAARRHCHSSAGDDESDLDVMLVERLSALEDFLTRQGLDV